MSRARSLVLAFLFAVTAMTSGSTAACASITPGWQTARGSCCCEAASMPEACTMRCAGSATIPTIAIQAAHPSSQPIPEPAAAALYTSHRPVATLSDTPRSLSGRAPNGASAPKRYLLACVFRL